jgi:hypothetical protein
VLDVGSACVLGFAESVLHGNKECSESLTATHGDSLAFAGLDLGREEESTQATGLTKERRTLLLSQTKAHTMSSTSASHSQQTLHCCA